MLRRSSCARPRRGPLSHTIPQPQRDHGRLEQRRACLTVADMRPGAFATLLSDMPRTRKGRRRGSKARSRAKPNLRTGSRAKLSSKERRARKVLRLHQARISLNKDYSIALGDLYAAGLHRIHHPDAPGWYYAQRVTVAILRLALARAEQALHDARAATAGHQPLERGPTQLADFHLALRVREGACLLRLRDRAREVAEAKGSWSRTLATYDERRLVAARQRKELPRLALELNRDGAWLMSPPPTPVQPA